MRVPNITTYYSSTYRLGNLTEDLQRANLVASTQKRLNEISDDPLALSQTLSLKNTIGNLEQIEKNVSMGKSWLESVEASLISVNDLILDAKKEVARLANDSATDDERYDAIERIDNIIAQIVSLGNTQVNGNYIFAGTDTNVRPFVWDRSSEPEQVLYTGNDIPFEVRTDRNSGVQVGRNGKATFWDDEVEINTSNNTIVFKEDNGHGTAFEKTMTATIPDGLYTRNSLATAVRNAVNAESENHGYGISYTVEYDDESQTYAIKEDGSYTGYMRSEFMWSNGGGAYIKDVQGSSDIVAEDIQVNVLNPQALAIGTHETDPKKPIRFTWNEAGQKWMVENNPGYILPGSLTGTSRHLNIDMTENGTADIAVSLKTPVKDKAYVEFKIVPAKGDHSTGHEIGFTNGSAIYVPPVSDGKPVHVTDIVINTSGNNTINFVELNATGGTQTLSANFNTSGTAVTYTDMDQLSKAIETAMETASAAPTSGANTIDYAVSYDPDTSRFNIRENGSDLNQLTINWSASTAAAQTLGYYSAAGMDDVIDYPHSSVTIDYDNNTLAFQESLAGTAGPFTTLMASIPVGTYETMPDLARAVETAMEDVSVMNYDVTYDAGVDRFQIQGSGGAGLTDFNILWNTGPGASKSIGEILGFDPENDDITGGLGPYTGDADPALMARFSTTVNTAYDMIDFQEVHTSGTATTLNAIIPGGTYNSIHGLETAIEDAMNEASAKSGNKVVYDVSYDEVGNHFDINQTTAGYSLTGFNLLWKTGANSGRSIGELLGFDMSVDDTGGVSYSSSSGSAPTWVSFDKTNNRIDFQEIRTDGTKTDFLSVEIPPGNYRDVNTVAAAIQDAMRRESPNGVNYAVSFDSDQGYLIKGSSERIKGFDLLWETGDNSDSNAAQQLGFSRDADVHVSYAESDESVVNITINNLNNKIDFKEVAKDPNGKETFGLTATVASKVYTSMDELALEVKKALDAESRLNGNAVDYSVSWDGTTEKFTIKENGTLLEEFHLQWNSGYNAPLSQGGTGLSMGNILGFSDDADDISQALKSEETVEWGVFNTLIELKQYLKNNDRDGIERSINRLETNYDNMSSRIADTGMKYNRLSVRETITTEVKLSMRKRASSLEDADMIKSIMDLQNIQTAYQAALSSTSRVLNLSLVDYLR